MQTELEKGTLVWVTPRIGEAWTSREMVEKHGNLWVVDGIAMRGDGPKPAWYWCKSLSNGYVYDFRADEIEVKDEAEPNNVRQDEGAR